MRAFCPSTEWLNGARQEPFLASVEPVVSSTVRDAAEQAGVVSGVASNGAPFTSKEAPSYYHHRASFEGFRQHLTRRQNDRKR
jgi:hypothetical protein